eukprot:1189732-Prorocentrum_minimum.AAC.2
MRQWCKTLLITLYLHVVVVCGGSSYLVTSNGRCTCKTTCESTDGTGDAWCLTNEDNCRYSKSRGNWDYCERPPPPLPPVPQSPPPLPPPTPPPSESEQWNLLIFSATDNNLECIAARALAEVRNRNSRKYLSQLLVFLLKRLQRFSRQLTKSTKEIYLTHLLWSWGNCAVPTESSLREDYSCNYSGGHRNYGGVEHCVGRFVLFDSL